MKALNIVVLSVMIGTMGCGTASSTCPDGQVENEQGNCTNECSSDFDCSDVETCTDNKCVLALNCIDNSDCSSTIGEGYVDRVCHNGYCKNFLIEDPYYGTNCNSTPYDPNVCGEYTVCSGILGECDSACFIRHKLETESAINLCAGKECAWCSCIVQGMEYNAGVCMAYDNACWQAAATGIKDQLAKGTWNRITELPPECNQSALQNIIYPAVPSHTNGSKLCCVPAFVAAPATPRYPIVLLT